MDFRPERLDPPVARIESTLTEWLVVLPPHRRVAAERWLGDAAALRFHLREGGGDGSRRYHAGGSTRPPIVAVIGGTGTGKSTLVNRLNGTTLTASSFRRTFTSGPVAIVAKPEDLPPQWLGWEHTIARPEDLPVRGRDKVLIVAVRGGAGGGTGEAAGAFLGMGTPVDRQAGGGAAGGRVPTLIDTPDLDGDTPLHHAQADRVFRWAEAVVFVVTPEKYQMTELPPYYRLARRYGVPALYVMNKCEESVVADDYQRQLAAGGFAPPPQPGGSFGEAGGAPDRPSVYIVARDDAAYEPPAAQNLAALRARVNSIEITDRSADGLRNRAGDVMLRLSDQIVAPLREDRREIDRLIAALHGMETPVVGVNVNPLTQQLQRRLQQKSILYLIGPQRVLDRVRQAPSLLARLPRAAWDWFRTGEVSGDVLTAQQAADRARQAPDFHATLADQFALVQSRIDDVVRGSPLAAKWADADPAGGGSYAAARIDPKDAGRIADEELAELKAWLERRWNANPRDTRTVERLLKSLPGGKKLVKWTESAPYLLTLVLATHSAMIGHIDLIILGGYSLATWIGERLSNEVTARARQANVQIEQRFVGLASEQIRRVTDWLDRQAPAVRAIDELERRAAEAAEMIEA